MMCIIHIICFHNMCVMYVFVLSYVSYMYPTHYNIRIRMRRAENDT